MKKIALLASIFLSATAFADWGDATGGGTPQYPQICVRNTTPYSIRLTVDNVSMYVSPQFTMRQRVYQYNQVLVSMDTRQIGGRYNPIWTQTYLTPSSFGCSRGNTVTIALYGNTLVFN